MKLASIQDLYVSELQDLLNAEMQLVKALPKMAKAATTPELSTAFEDHLEETKGHADRLEAILNDLGEKPGRKKCEGMKGLVTEGSEAIDADGDDTLRDAAIIVAAQKVEHYEIAGYGSVCALARILGRQNDVSILETTLEEEKAADKKLTRIAESRVNLAGAR